jgi:cytochrome c-type biogenesis protein CcsB
MNNLLKIAILTSITFSSLLAFADNKGVDFKVHPLCAQFSDDMPVQAGGRVKPYFVLAKDSIKFMTGKAKAVGKPANEIFCTILLNKRAKIEFKYPILVEHVDSKKFLGLKDSERFIDVNILSEKEMVLRSEIVRQKENNSYKKDLTKTYNRLATFKQILNGDALTVYTKVDDKMVWEPIGKSIELNDAELLKLITATKNNYIQEHGDRYLLELTYVKSHIFSYAILVTLLAIFLAVLMKSMKGAVIVSVLTILLQTVGIIMRVLISGRAPITNMYETVMFSGYGALVIALIMLLFKKERTFLLAGLGYNILCLFMMMFANGMLSSSISPLMPVLRDNFWLSTHVSTIILSYAALALSWIVANITLIKLRFKQLTKKDYRYNQSLIYTCMKIGIILLAAGIILGGVWADYSWGRFWGWDPKETWSLIVLLFYMAIMHGKYTSWITTHRFVLLGAAGFMTVMMAWFGVNYILASGLHSYGFSEGGALFLGSFFIIQLIIIFICSVKPQFKSDEA